MQLNNHHFILYQKMYLRADLKKSGNRTIIIDPS